MISIDADIAGEIVRMLNSYAEELHNVLETQDNNDELIKWLESDIANVDATVSYIERKLQPANIG
jgi:hypothetical protein